MCVWKQHFVRDKLFREAQALVHWVSRIAVNCLCKRGDGEGNKQVADEQPATRTRLGSSDRY